MISKIIRSSTNLLHPKVNISRTRLPCRQLRVLSGFHAPPPLLYHSTRARTYHAAPLVLQSQVRAISLWTLPKMALRTVRLPAIVAGTTLTTATIASNKFQGKNLNHALALLFAVEIQSYAYL